MGRTAQNKNGPLISPTVTMEIALRLKINFHLNLKIRHLFIDKKQKRERKINHLRKQKIENLL